jgi:hypothetical protein
MATFNRDEYETVDDRLARLHGDARFADVRIVTINHTTPTDRAVGMWVVEARIYLNREDQLDNLPIATGWAFEIDGQGMANRTSALENAETSARGRAMQALAMSGSKKGPSRQEMQKVAKGVTPPKANTPQVLLLDETARASVVKLIASATTKDELRAIWQGNIAHLDETWQNSLDETVSLKTLIIARQGEVK